MLKKIRLLLSLVIVAAVLASGIGVSYGAPKAKGAPKAGATKEAAEEKAALPDITALAAVIMDAKTGAILYDKDMSKLHPPASTTKIITAIVALESGRLDERVTVSKRAGGTKGSRLGLKEGQSIKMDQLLIGLMLPSGNDAANAIAEHLGGTTEGFAKLMTEKALQIGAKDSAFVNPSGLGSVPTTTAFDLAVITRYCLNNPRFAKIVKTKQANVALFNDKGKPIKISVKNSNQLLGQGGVDGVKTGTTTTAGQCLVVRAVRGGKRIITVVLNSFDRYDDTKRLLEYGFKRE